MEARGRRVRVGASARRSTTSKAKPRAAATVSMIAWARWVRMKFCRKSAPRRASVECQRRRSGTVPASGCAAASGFKAGRPIQVHQHFQKSRRQAPVRNSTHPTSQLTATTFVPRRVLYELRAGRDISEQRALRLLRHSGAGGASKPAHRRNSRRLRGLLSLCSARSLRNLDYPPQPRKFV